MNCRRRQWQPTPVLLPGKSHGRRSLVGCSPWGREELDVTERLHFHFSLSCTGEGNDNPLQCSCLENPRDREAWWAAIYGVAQSWTRLKWLSSSSNELSDKIGSILHHEKYTFQTPRKGRMNFKFSGSSGMWYLNVLAKGKLDPSFLSSVYKLPPLSLVFYYSWRDLMHVSGYIPAVTLGSIQTTSLWSLPLAILWAQKHVHFSVFCPKEDRLKGTVYLVTENKVWAFRHGLLRSWIPRIWPRRGISQFWFIMTHQL